MPKIQTAQVVQATWSRHKFDFKANFDRVLCKVCGKCVGQYVNGVAEVVEEHFAACGLVCGGSPSFTGSGKYLNAIKTIHFSNLGCYKCSPKKCPACGNQPKYYASQSVCARCEGRGTVPGLEID